MAKMKLVTKADDETWTFRCGYPTGCGDPATGEPFISSGWGKREDAAARGRQHLAEHDGTPMPDLDTFRQERGLTAETAGKVDPTEWEL